MCDYSLGQQASRRAVTGERLVTMAFGDDTTVGFAACGAPAIAICLEPGTELRFSAPVGLTGFFRFLLTARAEESCTARVRRMHPDKPFHHHDALEFGNGQTVLLADLRPGQQAVVLRLPICEQGNRAEQQVFSSSSLARTLARAPT